MLYTPGNIPLGPLPDLLRFLRTELSRISTGTLQVRETFNQLIAAILANFSGVGYAGLTQTTPDQASADITTAWQTWVHFDNVPFTPFNITPDPIGHGLIFDREGVFNLSMFISMGFTEANHGRELYVRVYNATKGTGSSPVAFPVGRNQPGQAFSVPITYPVDDTVVGDLIVVQISASETITGVVAVSSLYDSFMVGEYRGELVPEVRSQMTSRALKQS